MRSTVMYQCSMNNRATRRFTLEYNKSDLRYIFTDNVTANCWMYRERDVLYNVRTMSENLKKDNFSEQPTDEIFQNLESVIY